VLTHFRTGRVVTCILTEQLFPAKGWRVDTVERGDPDRLVVALSPTRSTAVCSGCGERKTRFHDVKPAREWRHLDWLGISTVVRARLRRIKCRRCGVSHQRRRDDIGVSDREACRFRGGTDERATEDHG
jgi:transposase